MNVAILGTGLIGGSIGLALRAAGEHHVTVFDRDPSATERAVERGAADAGAPSIRKAVADADVVFVATPVGAIVDVVAEAAAGAKAGAVLTDVGSTKHRVVVEVERSLPPAVSFVGGHPMAGTEEEGIDAAREGLFQNAWWILTPTQRSGAESYRVLHNLLTTLGARVMALDPRAHDDLMATISHVPQLTATALMNLAADRGEEHAGLLALAAGGFRDVTRVAASNPEIWLDICEENREAIASALESFSARLLELRDLVASGGRDQLRQVFLRAREARRNLPGKLVEGDLFEVRMGVPDRPGVLAEVTTSIGNLGINIEDLQLTHASEGGRGTLHLSIVGEPDARRVLEELLARGFDARVEPM